MYRGFVVALCSVLLVVTAAVAQTDVPNSADHPLLTRMPGYFIASYAVEEFAGFDPTVIGGKAVHWEGKKFALGYDQKEGATRVSTLQIVRNYQTALQKIGAVILGGDERRLAAELRKDGALTGIYVEAYNEGRNYEVTIVQTQAMRQDVTADAAAMGKDLAATGKTILQGIYFDTGSAVLKSESETALAEMAKLFKSSPDLKAFIVGHTDTTGLLDANLKLSAERAAAVMKALVTRGIAPVRLKAAGVGPYAPIGPNTTEQGKARNRRVELVQQ